MNPIRTSFEINRVCRLSYICIVVQEINDSYRKISTKNLLAYKFSVDGGPSTEGLIYDPSLDEKSLGILLMEGQASGAYQWNLINKKDLNKFQKHSFHFDYNPIKNIFFALENQHSLTPDSDFILINNKIDESGMLFDINGNVIEREIYFDYISSRISNENYDLKLAEKILRERSDIEFCLDRFNKDNNSAIQHIPSYNSFSGVDKCIEFIWKPTLEDYKKVWEKCLKYNTTYPSTKKYDAVFDLDMLGLKSALKH